MTKLGYMRVSTDDQRLLRQEDQLREAGCERIFSDDGVSGSLKNRPALDAILDYARPGDTIVIVKLDRLGRNTLNLLTLIEELQKRNITLQSLGDRIDPSTPEGRAMMRMGAVFAELERDLTLARTREGLAAARARGRVGGRKPALTGDQVNRVRRLHASKTLTWNEIADSVGVSVSTAKRAVRQSD